MTQTVRLETSSVSASVGREGVAQAHSPGAEEDPSLFARLLMLAQSLSVPDGQGSPVVLPWENPPSEQHEPPAADEITQAFASLGLPVLVGNTSLIPPLAMPVENTPDAESVRPPKQALLLPQVATDTFRLTYTPAEPESVQAKGVPDELAVFQTSLADGDVGVSLGVQQANSVVEHPLSPSATLPNAALPLPEQMTPVARTDPMPEASLAAEWQPGVSLPPDAQRLLQNANEKAQPASEVSPSGAEWQNPVAVPAQASNTGQPQQGEGHQYGNATLTAPKGTRSQAKRFGTSGVTEKGSPLQSSETGLHRMHGVDVAALNHRAQDVVHQPRTEVSAAEVIRQVAQRLEAMVSAHTTRRVTLQLEPEHLGRLRVTISVSDGAIHTHIVADNHAVRQMLESNSSLLQQAMQERGLQLGALQVSVQGDGRHALLHQPYTPPPSARGWPEGESAMHAINEASLGRATPGGINLLA